MEDMIAEERLAGMQYQDSELGTDFPQFPFILVHTSYFLYSLISLFRYVVAKYVMNSSSNGV